MHTTKTYTRVTIYPGGDHGWSCTTPETYEARVFADMIQINNEGQWQDWAGWDAEPDDWAGWSIAGRPTEEEAQDRAVAAVASAGCDDDPRQFVAAAWDERCWQAYCQDAESADQSWRDSWEAQAAEDKFDG